MGANGYFPKKEDLMQNLNGRSVREVMERTSTGSGLELILESKDENNKEKENNHSCGGL